jgi:hypothetical protein
MDMQRDAVDDTSPAEGLGQLLDLQDGQSESSVNFDPPIPSE